MMLRLTCSTLAMIAMTAPAAFSLTADEVWQTWETYLTDSGYEIAIGSREEGGSALVLKDVVLTASPDEATTTTVTLPTIRMDQTGGADIRTEYPDGASFHFAGTSQQAGETVTMVVEGNVDLAGMQTISREEGGHQVDTSTGPEVVVAVTGLTRGEDSLGGAGMPLTLTMRDLTSTNTFLGGLNTLSEGRIGSLTGLIDIADPEGTGVIKGQVEMDEILIATETNFPTGHDDSTAAALTEALRAGATLTGKGSFASLGMTLEATGDGVNGPQDMAADISSGAGSIAFGLADGRLGYQADISDVAYDLAGAELPFPVQIALGAVSIDLQFPLLASEEPQSFKLAYSLGDLVLNDAIWGMIDQKGALPRDPANLDIDLTGELRIHQDLMTYAQQAEAQDMAMDTPPISPVALTLNQLALSALGASAAADGAVSFPDPDNLDIATGTLNAQFNGVNGLLDKLVEAGLIAPDQVQGTRMMLMMIAKPVDGQADALQTTLELKEDGSVFANGMQLK